jgi:hypothetical protein
VCDADAKLTGKLRRDAFAGVGQREMGLIEEDSEKDTEKDENDIDIPFWVSKVVSVRGLRFQVQTTTP